MIKYAILFFASLFLIIMFLFKMDEFFLPKYRKLENKVYKQSEQYNDGMIRDLENLRMEYIKSNNQEQKEVIKQTILHRFSVYSSDSLPIELKAFYTKLKNE